MFRRVLLVTGTAFGASVRRFSSLMVPACLLILPATSYPEDSYLDAISIEAGKLGDSSAADGDAVDSQAPADDPAMQFEQALEARYRGTFLFYKKLPKKSREEVLLEHRQGASIDDVRRTIMNRYLHSR